MIAQINLFPVCLICPIHAWQHQERDQQAQNLATHTHTSVLLSHSLLPTPICSGPEAPEDQDHGLKDQESIVERADTGEHRRASCIHTFLMFFAFF